MFITKTTLCVILLAIIFTVGVLVPASLLTTSVTNRAYAVGADPTLQPDGVNANHECGAGDNAIKTSIDFGCKGRGNAILDLTFAIIRWLSYGAGLVIVGSVVVAGIQYTTSRGDPQATAAAENRIKSAILALLVFIFAFAILNYLIPGLALNA